MFDDSQTTQAEDSEAKTNVIAPAMGLGTNPSPPYAGSVGAPSSAPQVVLSDVPPADGALDVVEPTTPTPLIAPAAKDDLNEIKRHALAQLSPLVNQLQQTPEEKYKTLMMMIQASDNQQLIGEAYEAAQAITDEKVKAEALLNIVNEINYFTAQNPNNDQA